MTQAVVAIGAANVDIHGFTEKPLLRRDSNPGRIETCLGGVSRNVSENLVKMGVKTTLITAIGDDPFGRQIREHSTQTGIDLSHCLIVPEVQSSTYMAIMDDTGDMALALSDMRILDKLKVSHLQARASLLRKAPAIVADAGLTTEVMQWLVNTFPDQKIILDPVSTGKCRRMKSITGQFYCLKMNQLEAEFLADTVIRNDHDLTLAADRFMAMGVRKIYITLGAEGVYYRHEGMSGRVEAPRLKSVNATGAGDAFTAAVVYGELLDWEMEKTARFAVGAAAVALMSRHTVSEEMSLDVIQRWMHR